MFHTIHLLQKKRGAEDDDSLDYPQIENLLEQDDRLNFQNTNVKDLYINDIHVGSADVIDNAVEQDKVNIKNLKTLNSTYIKSQNTDVTNLRVQNIKPYTSHVSIQDIQNNELLTFDNDKMIVNKDIDNTPNIIKTNEIYVDRIFTDNIISSGMLNISSDSALTERSLIYESQLDINVENNNIHLGNNQNSLTPQSSLYNISLLSSNNMRFNCSTVTSFQVNGINRLHLYQDVLQPDTASGMSLGTSSKAFDKIWYSSLHINSNRHLKENIFNLNFHQCSDFVALLKPCQFEYKKDKQNTITYSGKKIKEKHNGFVLEQIIQDTAHERAINGVDIDLFHSLLHFEKDKKFHAKPKSFKMLNLIPILVCIVNGQNEQIKEMNNQIYELEKEASKVDKLNTEIKLLNSKLDMILRKIEN